MAVDVDAGTFAHVAQVDAPLFLGLLLRQLERCLVNASSHRYLGLVAEALPCLESLQVEGFLYFGCFLGEGEFPGVGGEVDAFTLVYGLRLGLCQAQFLVLQPGCRLFLCTDEDSAFATFEVDIQFSAFVYHSSMVRSVHRIVPQRSVLSCSNRHLGLDIVVGEVGDEVVMTVLVVASYQLQSI